jgi:hypothetical protein
VEGEFPKDLPYILKMVRYHGDWREGKLNVEKYNQTTLFETADLFDQED